MWWCGEDLLPPHPLHKKTQLFLRKKSAKTDFFEIFFFSPNFNCDLVTSPNDPNTGDSKPQYKFVRQTNFELRFTITKGKGFICLCSLCATSTSTLFVGNPPMKCSNEVINTNIKTNSMICKKIKTRRPSCIRFLPIHYKNYVKTCTLFRKIH